MADKQDTTEIKKKVKLSDGREAAILKGKGKDLIRAAKVAGANATSMELSFALASALTQIDGKPVVYEDLGEMPLDDVMTIINAVGEGPNFISRQPGTSSTSAEQPDGGSQK